MPCAVLCVQVVRPLLIPEQVASFLTGWTRTKALKAKLSLQHQSVLTALTAVQQQQQTSLQAFNEAASQLPIRPPARLLVKNSTSCSSSSCSSTSSSRDKQDVAAADASASCTATPVLGVSSEMSQATANNEMQSMLLPDALPEVCLLQVGTLNCCDAVSVSVCCFSSMSDV
jgi:hypothetical protein